ncbi:DNA-binding transcriptional regulator, PadR family [Streptoalloteichus tenebrarius]|uniref:DNA-binding transcriptional regulator, PadR family n=2 Tax=Streptoalloteichus tenebrarius (strain ATCC 17920 / DSM 40477 / JCM 4838 / CBS 697.72 / NBRC 16177 / NCIMB 11028 / NRRL B-12390 / A12253. 1 / ISP 5477) TaxID=1933 RepID=A0ABT1HRM1_STRSD|nr:DNA-binding transcriptional regulator, PadR family [Streptoalloteichus tenebrarius]BFF04646.1 hypothetical protein GCM10020241_63210 [Streptoalloteichus tenebrarius]
MDNPLVLPMLGLLAESPRHQYALLTELRARYAVLRAKTSTVYTLVRTLARHGLVTLDEAADTAERQEVRLTQAGLDELRRRVEAHLLDGDPNADPKFMIALAYLGALAPARAVELLRERARNLRADLRSVTDVLDRPDLRELHMIEAHFLASRLRHDAAWLTRLADRIETGDLEWPTPDQ